MIAARAPTHATPNVRCLTCVHHTRPQPRPRTRNSSRTATTQMTSIKGVLVTGATCTVVACSYTGVTCTLHVLCTAGSCPPLLFLPRDQSSWTECSSQRTRTPTACTLRFTLHAGAPEHWCLTPLETRLRGMPVVHACVCPRQRQVRRSVFQGRVDDGVRGRPIPGVQAIPKRQVGACVGFVSVVAACSEECCMRVVLAWTHDDRYYPALSHSKSYDGTG